MRKLTYAMQFKGQAGPAETPGTLKAKTTAPSCRLSAIIAKDGLNGSIESMPGGSAAFESTVTFTSDTSFLESGSIAFDAENKLHFSTVGAGYLAGCPDPQLKHGTVTWKLDRGEGQFEGASGLITSNFTVDDTGQVVDNHFGVIFLS